MNLKVQNVFSSFVETIYKLWLWSVNRQLFKIRDKQVFFLFVCFLRCLIYSSWLFFFPPELKYFLSAIKHLKLFQPKILKYLSSLQSSLNFSFYSSFIFLQSLQVYLSFIYSLSSMFCSQKSKIYSQQFKAKYSLVGQ